MTDVLGYKDKNVVITGAASGMGRAAAQLLVDAGANVHALDIAEVMVPVRRAYKVDMRDADSLDAAVAELPDEIYALFNCAGVPSPPFQAMDTVLINFTGLRYLTEALLPRMEDGGGVASIASTAGMGWRGNLDQIRDFLAQDNGYETAKEWVDSNADSLGDAYGFSKQCIIVYTMTMARQLAQRDIRINCIAPSPTDSAFMQKLTGEGEIPEEAVALFLPSNKRYATGEDMGAPLVMLNSRLAKFVSGQNLPVDFGYCAEVLMGQRDDLMGIA
jgi:NAD(P)-dependent dehydrogenase (short-subunit alcohol dehydrogenase family)